MDNITYIILLKNQSKNIPALAESLKAITGNLRKEYVIIDDFSDDNTKEVASAAFNSLPRCTIVTNDEYHGPAYSINKALSLAHGKFIHFVDGDEILDPNSTSLLLDACKALGASAACGLYGKIDKEGNKFKSQHETGDTILLDNPIKNILDNSVKDIRNFGYSGTLMTTYLLEEIEGVDEHVFTHNMSLALSAGKLSKFAFLKKTICFQRENMPARYDKKFEIYNNLLAIVDFIEANKKLAEKYTSEIYKALWSFLWELDKKYKVQSLPKYFLSRYMKKNLDLDTLIELYKGYIEQLEN